LDYLDRFPKIIASISKEDVLQVAQKYLQADRYLLVAVANKAEASILSPGLGKN